ncbi:MAG TPA: hypothetical protein VIT21_09335 [Chthoniobacterales bacterium]
MKVTGIALVVVLLSTNSALAGTVDNASSFGVTLSGSWTTATSPSGFYRANYLQDGNRGGNSRASLTPLQPSHPLRSYEQGIIGSALTAANGKAWISTLSSARRTMASRRG